MNLRALLLALPLIGCSGDTYGPPLLSACESKTITLTVTFLDTIEINRAKQRIEPGSPPVEAFAGRRVADPNHHILYVPIPRGRFDDKRFYLLGHEIGHSVCGRWHPEGEPR